MAAPMPANPLLRPVETPQRFAGVAPQPAGPRVPGNALVIPRTPPLVPPVPAVPAVPPVPTPPEPPIERISDRVPVPKADFPEEHHKDLHEKTMGKAFDDPEAQNFVREVYDVVRRANPNVHPRHVLEATRDAYHAVKHGFSDAYTAGYGVSSTARARHAAAQREMTAAALAAPQSEIPPNVPPANPVI